MNGQVHPPPQIFTFPFEANVALGTQPHEPPNVPDREHLLVVDDGRMPSWGRLVSFETTILRDGKPTLDIHTYSFGVSRLPNGKFNVRFQLWDKQVDTIVNHAYKVTANIHYHPE